MIDNPLIPLVAEELALSVDPRIGEMAAALAQRHGAASRGILFYGSCLRAAQLDGLMLDFYLIVSDYAQAYPQAWLGTANRLIPPNVFPFEHGGLLAKYAVLSEADFARLTSSATRNVSVWARFAQPSRLVWVANQVARRRIVAAVAEAAPTLLRAARPCIEDSGVALEIWRQSFALTYGAELRAERNGQAGSIVDADEERYRRFLAPALVAAGLPARLTRDGMIHFVDPLTSQEREAGAREWRRRRIEGKLLTAARLVKASATFAGGLDYLAWKINRHAGAGITIRPWQRRFPLIGALSLLPRLIAGGAVR
jgi:hypothetical protein